MKAPAHANGGGDDRDAHRRRNRRHLLAIHNVKIQDVRNSDFRLKIEGF